MNTASSRQHVFYVLSQNAKSVKDALEEKLWLDRRYRMTKVIVNDDDDSNESFFRRFDPDVIADMIAVPVMEPAIHHYATTGWGNHWILGHGHYECPLSTRQFAAKATVKVKEATK